MSRSASSRQDNQLWIAVKPLPSSSEWRFGREITRESDPTVLRFAFSSLLRSENFDCTSQHSSRIFSNDVNWRTIFALAFQFIFLSGFFSWPQRPLSLPPTALLDRMRWAACRNETSYVRDVRSPKNGICYRIDPRRTALVFLIFFRNRSTDRSVVSHFQMGFLWTDTNPAVGMRNVRKDKSDQPRELDVSAAPAGAPTSVHY